VPVNGVFILWTGEVSPKKRNSKFKKKTDFEEGFQSPEVRKKKIEKSPDLCIWFSFCGQKKVEGWFKSFLLYFWIYSQIWLNLPRDGWSSLFFPSFYGWYPHCDKTKIPQKKTLEPVIMCQDIHIQYTCRSKSRPIPVSIIYYTVCYHVHDFDSQLPMTQTTFFIKDFAAFSWSERMGVGA